tara:strand:- start:45916 stop:46032 length:117 start_codon:yes stop_codon:yes gene_type:complete
MPYSGGLILLILADLLTLPDNDLDTVLGLGTVVSAYGF